MTCLHCGTVRELDEEGAYCADMAGCEARYQGNLRLAELRDREEREGVPLPEDDPHAEYGFDHPWELAP